MDGRTNGWTDGRTDGRTCNDIVLSRHDRQKIFMKNISESSKKSYMYMYGLACVHLWTDGRVGGRTDGSEECYRTHLFGSVLSGVKCVRHCFSPNPSGWE